MSSHPTIVRRKSKPKPPPAPAPTPTPGKAIPESARLEPSAYDLDVAARRTAARPAPERPRGVVPPRRTYQLVDGIDPVELFMAYHLGITADDGYRAQNIHDLGRRFRTSPDRINQALKAYEIDAETVLNTDFDMAMAQLDIRVAPAGISKRELGRQLYEEFRSSPRMARDWAEELRRDAEENRRIFEKLK
jgi:hypothetical protein